MDFIYKLHIPFFLKNFYLKIKGGTELNAYWGNFLMTGQFGAQLYFLYFLKTETIGDCEVHNCNGNY